MVRAAVSASQTSVERPGSAPAPFSACPQAEPTPEAQKRGWCVCMARVQGCERGEGGRAGEAQTYLHMRATGAKRACVSGRGLLPAAFTQKQLLSGCRAPRFAK